MKLKLTKRVLYSVWLDTYNRAKRRGLEQDAAADVAQAEFDRLFAIIGGPEGWMELPAS